MLKSKALWIILGLFVITRLLFLWFALPNFFIYEDLQRGVLAHELISGGLKQTLYNYQNNTFSGGSLAVGFLAVPFFRLLGPSAFALKLVGLAISALILMVSFLFCRRFYDLKTAVIFSVLYFFPPPFYTYMSLAAMGDYFESLLFVSLMLFLFYEIIFGQKKHFLYYLALGFTCGLGQWFCANFGLALIAMFLGWFFFDHKFIFKRHFWVFAAGFLLGFVPWIWCNLIYSFEGLIFHGIPLAQNFKMANLLHLFDPQRSVFSFIFGSFGFTDLGIFNRRIFSAGYFLALVLASASILWGGRRDLLRSKESFFFFYFIVLGLVFQGLEDPALRYLISLYPFIFLLLSIFMNKLLESNDKPRILAGVLLIILLPLFSLGSHLQNVSPKFAGYLYQARGFSYEQFGLDSGFKYGYDLAALPKLIASSKNIDPRYLHEYFRGLAPEATVNTPADLKKAISLAGQVDPKYRQDFYCSFGYLVKKIYLDDLDGAKKMIRQVELEYRQGVYEDWVKNLALAPYPDQVSLDKTLKQIDVKSLPVFYQALGESFDERNYALYAKISIKYLPDLYKGAGSFLLERSGKGFEQ